MTDVFKEASAAFTLTHLSFPLYYSPSVREVLQFRLSVTNMSLLVKAVLQFSVSEILYGVSEQADEWSDDTFAVVTNLATRNS